MNGRTSTDDAAWRDSLVNAVDTVLGDSKRSGEARWVPLGSARPSEERNWFTLSGALKHKLSPNARLCFGDDSFGGDDDPSATIYSVNGFYEDPNGHHFQAPRDVPVSHRQIWYRKEPPGAILRSIKDLLSQSGDAPLADDLAKRIVQPVPNPGPSIPGLTSDQAKAYACCFEPGVQFVWGTPGTGKTRVLAKALADLIASGKRVLLVSVANIAVDNALIKLVADAEYEPGTVVRAGQAQLPELRARNEVLLPALAQAQTREAEGKARKLEASLSELVGRDTSALHAHQHFLADFDHNEVVVARQCVDAERKRHELKRQRESCLSRLDEASEKMEVARLQDEEWRQRFMAASTARQHLAARKQAGVEAATTSAELDRRRREHKQLSAPR